MIGLIPPAIEVVEGGVITPMETVWWCYYGFGIGRDDGPILGAHGGRSGGLHKCLARAS